MLSQLYRVVINVTLRKEDIFSYDFWQRCWNTVDSREKFHKNVSPSTAAGRNRSRNAYLIFQSISDINIIITLLSTKKLSRIF